MGASFSFAGKTVLVTGASQGIGLSVADAFAEAGADLLVLAENDGIHEAADAISTRHNCSVRAVLCDIACQAEVRSALRGVARFDVLINNAGFQPTTPILQPGADVDATFRRAIDVNVLGTYYVTREVIPKMPPGGRIVMTSSIWGRTGAARYSGYAASKHAVIGFMRSLAMELGPLDITVNAVCPGWVETEGAMWTMRDEATAAGVSVDILMDHYLRGQPIRGAMKPERLAPTYLFLASEAAADITGQCVGVDRGSFIG